MHERFLWTMPKKSLSAVNSRNSLTATIKARAKVNLSLFVTGIRPDGLHNLVTTFASVAVCDTIFVNEYDDSGGPLMRTSLTVDASETLIRGQNIPDDCSNLLLKGDQSFRSKSSDRIPHFHYVLHKDVPACSGLGAGSADCAAVLRWLNLRLDGVLSDRELNAMAFTLGADVPFCLHGGFALGKGAGENLMNLGSIPCTWNVLLVRPYEGISTKEAFQRIDGDRERSILSESEAVERSLLLAQAIKQGDATRVGPLLENDFLKPFIHTSSNNRKVYERLRALTSGACGLSGSGSALFGLFTSHDEIEEAFCEMSALKDVSWIRKTVFEDEGISIS